MNLVQLINNGWNGWRSGWFMLSVLLLTGCLGGNYQAPISDQSEVMDQSGPLIVTTSDDSPSRYGNTDRATSSTATPVVSANGARPATHQVVRGESLYSIAFQYDLDVRSLALANNLAPPYTVFVGQELTLELEQPVSQLATGESSVASVGRVVGNNSVARAQPASSTPRGVIRQPITRTSTVVEESTWQWPVRGRVLTNFQADTSARKGIDIGAVAGQPVRAAATGEVVYAGNGIQGSGNLIIIRHSERLLSAYAQNRTMLVSEGQQVHAGDEIGEAGANSVGSSTGAF